MRTWRFSLSVTAVTVCTGLGLVRALPLGQAPNQAELVTQTVAGVKFSTLPGFVLERVNPADRTDSYVALTFDSLGRLVVSKEQDHPRILLDNDKDGILESEQIISEAVRNCQGLWFDGPTLYAACTEAGADPVPPSPRPPDDPITPGRGTGRGGMAGRSGASPKPQTQTPATGKGEQPAGIFRMTDTTGDGRADSFDMVARSIGGIQEHGPHAIRRAPDGSYAFLSGNHATLPRDLIDPRSPVINDKDAQFLPYLQNFGRSMDTSLHSAVYLWKPKLEKFSVLFGGNRNAYDFAYNLAGEAFLFDSDMEWDINMPWYREVRTVHGIPGGNYGYRDGSGKYPEYYIDSLPPLREVGRGSPVGIEFYTSYAYPRQFFDNLFEADWSRGRLLYTALTPKGATYSARSDRAEFVHGEPFNITDVEVAPDGMLYFTTGGRNTTGGVWRLRYKGTADAPPDMTGILAVVRQPQPLSSWGWAAIENVKASMGASFATELARLARDAKADGMDRARAVYEMQRHGAPPDAALLTALLKDPDAGVRAAAVFAAGVQGGQAADGAAKAQAGVAAAALKDADPMVRRRAAEALVRMGQSADRPSLAPVADIYALLNDQDRFVRWAGRLALERTPRAEWRDRALKDTNPLSGIESMLALVNTAPEGESLQPLIDKQLGMMKANLSVDDRLRLFRAFQYTTTETPTGLTAAERERLHGLIVNLFPSTDERLNRELALMLAYAGQPQAIEKILSAMPPGDENQQLQLHYLYALRTLKDGWTLAQKTQLAEILGRASTWRGGAQFVNFVGQMFDAVEPLFATDEEKQVLFAKAPDFSPLTPEQLEEIKARQAQAGRGGGRGGAQSPLAARRAGRVISRQEMLEEMVFQPQQKLDAAAGREVFQADCASCHRFGDLGSDHGVKGLNLTGSPALATKYTLLEAVVLPDRKVAPEHETTVLTTTDGRTVRGVIVRENAQSVSLLTPDGTVAEVQTSQVKSRTREKGSIMSEETADRLGQTQLRNLAEFLVGSSSGAAPGGAK